MKHLIIRPSVVGDLTSVKGKTATLYGDVAVDWQRTGDDVTLNVSIPANCSADVYVPGESAPRQIKSGKYTFSSKL